MIDEKTQMFRLLDAFPLLVKKATTHSSETTLIYLHNQNVKLNFESFIYIIYIKYKKNKKTTMEKQMKVIMKKEVL
jgi:phosphotransferase system HPr-like phosphotransfer protein